MSTCIELEEPVSQIIIIGAGVAGLQVLNAVLKNNNIFRVVCLEALGTVGGVWSRCDPAYRLQVPYFWYTFPSYPWPFQPSQQYPTGPEVYRYILSFVEAHDLMQHIKLGCRVDSMLQDPFTHSWSVTYTELVSGQQMQLSASYVVVCSGAWNDPYVPPYPGQAQFQGLQLDSRNLLDGRVVVGKRLVIIGNGQDALDALAVTLASKATAFVVQIHRKPAWPFPPSMGWLGFRRLMHSPFATDVVPPCGSAGAGHASGALHVLSSPVKCRVWHSLASAVRRHLRPRLHELDPAQSLMHELMAENQVVHDMWLKLMRDKLVVRTHGEIASFTPDSIKLEDGREVQCDMVLYCTGFSKSSNYLPESVRVAVASTHMFLYRHMLHPDVPNLAFVGAEANTYSSLRTHGLQAEWLARVLEGSLDLPSPADMHANISHQQSRGGGGGVMEPAAKRNAPCNAMVYIDAYHDQLCKDMGQHASSGLAERASGPAANDLAEARNHHGSMASRGAGASGRQATLHSCFPWPWARGRQSQPQVQLQLCSGESPLAQQLQPVMKGDSKGKEEGIVPAVSHARYSQPAGSGSSGSSAENGEQGSRAAGAAGVITGDRNDAWPACGRSSLLTAQLAAAACAPAQPGRVQAGSKSMTKKLASSPTLSRQASRLGTPEQSPPPSNIPSPMPSMALSSAACTTLLSTGATAVEGAPGGPAPPIRGGDIRALSANQFIGSLQISTHGSSCRPSPGGSNGRLLVHAGNRSLSHSLFHSLSVAAEQAATASPTSTGRDMSQPDNPSVSSASNVVTSGVMDAASAHHLVSSWPASARLSSSLFKLEEDNSLHGGPAPTMRAASSVPVPMQAGASPTACDAVPRSGVGVCVDGIRGLSQLHLAVSASPVRGTTTAGVAWNQPAHSHSSVDTTGISRLDELLCPGVFARQSAEVDKWLKSVKSGPDGGLLERPTVPLTMADRARASLNRITERVSSDLKRALSNNSNVQSPAASSTGNIRGPGALSDWLDQQRLQGAGHHQSLSPSRPPLSFMSVDMNDDATVSGAAAGAAGAVSYATASNDDVGSADWFDGDSTILGDDDGRVMAGGDDIVGEEMDGFDDNDESF